MTSPTLENGEEQSRGRQINRAFKDKQADTVDLLSDGVPNSLYISQFHYYVNTAKEVFAYYNKLNNNRDKKKQDPKPEVNTIVLGLESAWVRNFSQSNNSNYM